MRDGKKIDADKARVSVQFIDDLHKHTMNRISTSITDKAAAKLKAGVKDSRNKMEDEKPDFVGSFRRSFTQVEQNDPTTI